MEKIYGNRRKWLDDMHPTVAEVLMKYPRYTDVDELVNQDFALKYGADASKQLLLTWEANIVPSIMKIAKTTTTAAIMEMYEECHEDEDLDPKECTNDDLAMYAFLLLVLLLPSHARNKGARKQTLSKFIDFKPIGTVLEEYLIQGRSHEPQPYLLCLGTRRMPSQFFIIVDQRAIPCQDNVVAAADKLFKLHFIFNVEYAAELKLFYQFLETFVYDVSCMTKIPNKVVELSAAIEAHSSCNK